MSVNPSPNPLPCWEREVEALLSAEIASLLLTGIDAEDAESAEGFSFVDVGSAGTALDGVISSREVEVGLV